MLYYRTILAALSLVTLLILAASYFRPEIARHDPVLSRKNLTIATVQKGVFLDYLPLHGKVEPRDTILVDAPDGGRAVAHWS